MTEVQGIIDSVATQTTSVMGTFITDNWSLILYVGLGIGVIYLIRRFVRSVAA